MLGWGKGGQKPESMFTSVRSVRVDQCLSEGKLSRARASPRRSLQCRAAKKRRDQHEQHHAATSGAVKFLSRRETLGVGLATYLLADGVNVARAEEEVQAFIPVEKLSRPARQEQIAALRKTINKAIIEHVKSDYRNSLELAFLDCITHNKMSKAGGSNGSIRIREELDSLGLKYLEKVGGSSLVVVCLCSSLFLTPRFVFRARQLTRSAKQRQQRRRIILYR